MYDRMIDKLNRVIREIDEKDRLSMSDIQLVDVAAHAMKSLVCVDEKMGGMSGASYRNVYSRDYSRAYSRDYSRDGKEEYLSHLRSMADSAPDDRTRHNLNRMARELERS